MPKHTPIPGQVIHLKRSNPPLPNNLSLKKVINWAILSKKIFKKIQKGNLLTKYLKTLTRTPPTYSCHMFFKLLKELDGKNFFHNTFNTKILLLQQAGTLANPRWLGIIFILLKKRFGPIFGRFGAILDHTQITFNCNQLSGALFYCQFSYNPIFNFLKKNLIAPIIKTNRLGGLGHYYSLLGSFLFGDASTLRYYPLYKYVFNISRYLVTYLYPNNFFFCFINFTHQKKFKMLEKPLHNALYNKYAYLFKKSYLNYKYIFEVFYNTFKYKNINYLVIFLKDLFKNVNFYKHQFLLFYLRCFMKLLGLPIFSQFNVNGLFIKFHGKIAKAGNSRRKKYLLQHQVISTAYKNNYIVDKFQLHSFTGVVGVTLILSF